MVDVIDAQALLVNMHKYFSPLHMKVVVGNIAFLENTSPTTIVKSSYLPFYITENFIVYVTQKKSEMVDYITKYLRKFKCVGVAKLPLYGLSLWILIIDVDQSVLM